MSCVSTLNERRSKSKASKWKLCKLKILSNNREKPDKKDNDRLEDEKEVEKGSFGFEFFWVTKDLRTFLRTLLLCVVTSLG